MMGDDDYDDPCCPPARAQPDTLHEFGCGCPSCKRAVAACMLDVERQIQAHHARARLRAISWEERAADDAMRALEGDAHSGQAKPAFDLLKRVYADGVDVSLPAARPLPPPQEATLHDRIEVTCPTCLRSFGWFMLKVQGLSPNGFVEITPECPGCVAEGR
jgi:hypothetical protein